MSIDVLKKEEQVTLSLRKLYSHYGYTQYKMSKFEEYDLYVRNKSFLLSDSVITFTDTNGKLMALKPDVTLSIVKNSGDIEGYVQKLYYNESVYRISDSTHAWREISQTGLECLGDVDTYQLSEVLLLAEKSLSLISEDYVLDVSDLELLSLAILRAGLDGEHRAAALSFIGQKNKHDLLRLAKDAGVTSEAVAPLSSLGELSGSPAQVLPRLRTLYTDAEWQAALCRFEAVLSPLPAEHLRIDFSVIHDLSYYNGIVFQGFVMGVPERVLSGGQYDRLMEKLGKSARAVGFAVYPERLDALGEGESFDVDAVLLYREDTDPSRLSQEVAALVGRGLRVTAQKKKPEKMTYRYLYEITESGVNVLEEHA